MDLATPPGALDGTLVRYVATYADGHSESWYALRTEDGGRNLRLAFDGTPQAQPGAVVRVWGDVRGETLHVSTYTKLESGPPPVESPALKREAAKQDSYAFVLVDTGAGVAITAAQAQTAFFSTTPSDKSFADFYNESSFGQYAVTGDVLGPYTYADMNCSTDGMANTIQPMITNPYNHYVYYIGQQESACGWSGLAEEGSVGRPATRVWLNGSNGCVVSAQEPGHNLGMMHSNTITCPGASFSAAVGSSCTIKEYGDRLTPMGSGCHQLNAYEKWYEQWLSGCNAVKVAASGSFNLVPPETQCPGAVQLLQIPLPAAQNIQDPEGDSDTLANYYVEMRSPGGTFDSSLTAGVYVYVADTLPTTKTAGHTYILDMNPQTSAFDPLSQGQTYTDPGGAITITLTSLSATGATIQVNVPTGGGANTCIDGTSLAGSGPATCMPGGSSSSSGGSSGSSSSGSGSSSGSTSGGSTSSGGSGSTSSSGGGSGGSTSSSGSSSGSTSGSSTSGGGSGSTSSSGGGSGSTSSSGGGSGGSTSSSGGSSDAGGSTGSSSGSTSGSSTSGGSSGSTGSSGGGSGGSTSSSGSSSDAGGSTGGSSGSTGGSSTSSSGSGSTSGSGGGSGSPRPPADAGSTGAFDAFTQGSAGCSCETAGARSRPLGSPASLGLLIGIGWAARRRRPLRR
jgi:hypothetical protein